MKDIQAYQVIVGAVGLIFFIISIRQTLRGKITLFEAIFWPLFWAVTVALALEPHKVTVFMADTFGIKSNSNAIIFTALGVLFFIQYHLFLTIKRQNKTITDMVRKIALDLEEKETETKDEQPGK